MKLMNPDDVQAELDKMGSKTFQVSFIRKDGTEAEYTGKLMQGAKSDSVAMLTEKGYKRFNIKNVTFIEVVEWKSFL